MLFCKTLLCVTSFALLTTGGLMGDPVTASRDRASASFLYGLPECRQPKKTMSLRPFILSLIALWALSALVVLVPGDLEAAGSFGAINALFSGIALALAIYSMILQQKQNAEFERKTLATLARQAETLGILKNALLQQADVARVTALTFLIEREEQRIETLKEWGRQNHGNEQFYANGLKAAQGRIDRNQDEIARVGGE